MEIKATYNGTEYRPVESVTAGGKTAMLSASADLENKEIIISDNGDTEVTPSEGKDGISRVVVHTNVGGGGENMLLYARNADNLFSVGNTAATVLPNIFSVHFGERIKSLKSIFRNAQPEGGASFAGSKLTISTPSSANVTNLSLSFALAKYETIELDFDTSHVTDWSEAFAQFQGKNIIGTLNFKSATTVSSIFDYYTALPLENIMLAPNCLSRNINFAKLNKLTDTSIISVANGLKNGAYTITLHATVQSKCQSIMGTISQVTDGDETYDFFTADVSGDTSLESFITTTKGWTIA